MIVVFVGTQSQGMSLFGPYKTYEEYLWGGLRERLDNVKSTELSSIENISELQSVTEGGDLLKC